MINCTPSFAGYTPSAAKTKKSESRNSSAKKPKPWLLEPASVVLVRVFQNSELVAGRRSWQKIIQRCKNCSRHALVSCNLLCCAFCSLMTLIASTFVSRRDVGWGAVRDVLLGEEQRGVCCGSLLRQLLPCF